MGLLHTGLRPPSAPPAAPGLRGWLAACVCVPVCSVDSGDVVYVSTRHGATLRLPASDRSLVYMDEVASALVRRGRW